MTGEAGVIERPFLKLLPDREFTDEFLTVRQGLFERIDPYYDREHLTRAGDWMLAIAPEAPEYLVLAALSHDLERSVPGGPKLDMAVDPWDSVEYNEAHTGRSADLVPGMLAEHGASDAVCEAVRQPIREHEFGGGPEGDLMQAADSLSFLETNGGLCARWVIEGSCDYEKTRAKLSWMRDRIRLERARPMAARLHDLAVLELDRRLKLAEKEDVR